MICDKCGYEIQMDWNTKTMECMCKYKKTNIQKQKEVK